MSTSATDTIECLTVHWAGADREARTPATRLRLERVLGMLDLHPPGMPSGALLVIRRISGLPPLTQLTGLPPAWARQVQQRIAQLYRSASSPHNAPEHAGSVLFADAAELLVLLTRDVVRAPQSFLQRWYWREIVPVSTHAPGAALAALWSAHARALPAAFAQLPPGDMGAAVALLNATQVGAVVRELHSQFALPPDVLPVLDSAPPDERPAASATGALAPPWQPLIPDKIIAPNLSPPAEYLLGLSLTLYRTPGVARSPAFAERAAAWLHAAWSAYGLRMGVRQFAPTTGEIPELAPSTSDAEIAAPAPAAQTVSNMGALQATPSAETPPPVSREANVAPPHAPASVPAASGAAADAPIFAALKPVIPEGIATDLGGALYLINLLTWLDWPQPEGLSGWALLEALARGLLDRADDTDPLWALLAQLDGRDPGTPLSAAPAPEHFRLPLNRVPSAWVVVEQHDRVYILAADGAYLIADIPQQERSLADSVQAEMAAYGIQATWQRGDLPLFTPLRDDLRARLGPGAACWVERVLGYVNYALRHMLNDSVATLLYKTGRMVVSRTHIDLFMNFDQISLSVRRAGLDANPGWVPDLGYIVLFHFVED